MKTPLIVVDCQEYFLCRSEENGDETWEEGNARFDRIAKLVSIYVKRKAPVYVLQYNPVGLDTGWASRKHAKVTNTDSRIRAALKGYKNKKILNKDSDSGSDELLEAWQSGSNPSKVNFVGVNAGACVFATANNLWQEHKIVPYFYNELTFNTWNPGEDTEEGVAYGFANYDERDESMPINILTSPV